MRVMPRVLAIAALALGAIGWAAAEPLVSLKSGAGAPIPEAITHLMTVDGRPVAVSADALWVLRADLSAWERAGQRPAGEILGVASGRRGHVFLGALGGPVERIEALDLETGTPRMRPLPPLPVPVLSPRGALLVDTLYVAGTAEGQPKLFAFNTALADAKWVAHPAWSGNGEMTSLVAQTAALFVTLADGDDSLGPTSLAPGRASGPNMRMVILSASSRGISPARANPCAISDTSWRTRVLVATALALVLAFVAMADLG